MISLIKGFYKQYFDKPCFKILIIGCEGSGKTTYINAIKLQEGQKHTPWDKIQPTVGLNICKISTKTSDIIFWDLGG